MQSLIAHPREDLTAEQVRYLLVNSSALKVDAGCELLDNNLQVIEDISSDFRPRGGRVARQSFADIHGNASLTFARELSWGKAIVRPYMLLSDNRITARFNLGAYYTSAPNTDYGAKPILYEVEGIDVIHRLFAEVGESYVVTMGTTVLSKVEEILLSQGFTSYIIDQSKADVSLPSDRVWAMEDGNTWLKVVNELLAAIGYAGVWTDWNGAPHCEPYIAPRDRASEWTYHSQGLEALVSKQRSVNYDFYEVPNHWIAIRSNNVDGPPPIEGDGIFKYTNFFDGPTSVEGRDGRVIPRYLSIEAADQESLEQRAMQSINADIGVERRYQLGTSPNPLHWHFDRLTLNDEEIGAPVEVLGYSWELPLDGELMSHTWKAI